MTRARFGDIATCNREPIHIPGAIQPHGVLIALGERDLVAFQASANLPALLGVPLADVLGRPFERLLDAPSRQLLRDVLGREHPREGDPLALTVADRRMEGVVHRHDGAVIVELEPTQASAPVEASLRASLRRALVLLEAAPTLERLLETVVDQVKRLTRFDRVMIYRFDDDGHGMVLAERVDEPHERYLGLHYPASDIPRQARALYLRNWIRSIPDARYTPVPLVPALRPDTGAPLDLSYSTLRSVSPVHLEYLANMGVRASMSLSLVVQGRLWGLVSCGNHRGPHHLSLATRADCELLARLVSLEIAAIEDREVAARRTARAEVLARVSEALRGSDDVLDGLLRGADATLSLLAADGLAVVEDDRVVVHGRTPPAAMVPQVADAMRERGDGGLFVTAELASVLPEAASFAGDASGVLGFVLPGPVRRSVLWFRPEQLQTVDWGGDPRKPLEGDGCRLHPRRSFALWQEQVRGRSLPWTANHVEAAVDLRRHVIEADLAHQVARTRRAVAVRDDVVAVVSHDLRGPLGVIELQTLMLQAARGDELRPQLERIQRAVDRMKALARDLLDLATIEAGQFTLQRRPEPVRALVEEALMLARPLAEAKSIRLRDDVRASVSVDADRERVFQVLANLLGNAIKFTPQGGQVTLTVAEEQAQVVFRVDDTGPGVAESQRAHLFDRYWQGADRSRGGAGLGLYIARGIVDAHGGRIWVEEAAGGGASFGFTLPVA